MKLHLICHGMMLFLYRRRSSECADGYRILIPQCPLFKTFPQHELRLGTSPGAPKTYLSYGPEPQPTKYYDLQFGVACSQKRRGPKDVLSNLSLYENLKFKAQSNYGNGKPSGVAFAIDIPYPKEEIRSVAKPSSTRRSWTATRVPIFPSIRRPCPGLTSIHLTSAKPSCPSFCRIK